MSLDTADIEFVTVPDEDEVVPEGHDTAVDIPLDSTYRCIDCGTPLTYSGKGRPPVRCDLHKKSKGSTGPRDSAPRGATGSVGLRAFRENFTQRGTELGIMVMMANEIDGLAIISGVDDVADALVGMAQTNPKLRARLEKMGSKMSLLSVLAATAGIAIPIAANHGLVPEMVGMPYIGKLRAAKARVDSSRFGKKSPLADV